MTERTEAQNFMLEAAEQHGFILADEDGEAYTASADAVVALVTAAREQGRNDVRQSKRPVMIADAIREMKMTVGTANVARLLERIAQEVECLDISEAGFQTRCQRWLDVVTEGDPTDLDERIARFVEEALELAQSLGLERNAAMQLVHYVFDRPAGDPAQEFGGVATTLAVLAEFTGHHMIGCGDHELARVWAPEVIEKIRGKRSRRHGRGPLPGTVEADLVPSGGLGDQPRAFNDFRYAD